MCFLGSCDFILKYVFISVIIVSNDISIFVRLNYLGKYILPDCQRSSVYMQIGSPDFKHGGKSPKTQHLHPT